MFKSIFILITFLTRIPLPIIYDFKEEDLGKTSKFFPVVGFIIGIIVLCMISLFSRVNIQLGAVMGILCGIALTGGLHLDGLMDTADGLFSARNKEKILEIMKDSRVGAHGVTAAIILILLKYVLYQTIISEHNFFYIIPMGFILSRWLIVFAILNFPGARKEGFAKIFIRNRTVWDLPVATIFMITFPIILKQWSFFLPLVATFFFSWIWLNSISKKLGGLTGDIYGAVVEISEVFFLLLIILCEELLHVL